MTADTSFVATSHSPPRSSSELSHLVAGSGGSRAILASAGFIYALHKCNITDFDTIGGVSGGSLPSLMFAAGIKPGLMVKLAVEIDFSSKLNRHTNVARTFLAFLLKERLAQTRPRQAVMGSEKLEAYIDELSPTWPEKYWTMAVAGKTQVVFTSKGVFQYLHDGSKRQLSDKPAPLGMAVAASCAVPGIIDPKYWNGIYLFDGALSWDGQCPIGVVVRDMGAAANEVVACDVSVRTPGGKAEFLKNFWRVFCGKDCVWPEDERDPTIWVEQGTLLVRPRIDKFGSLQFSLSADQKWEAVMTGFATTLTSLKQAGLIDGAVCSRLSLLATDRNIFMQDCAENATSH
jgi:predicted acylesterase/phospholipase RssA